MIPQWWPVLVFGPPAVVVALILIFLGIHRKRGGWVLAGAVLILPFSYYLSGTNLPGSILAFAMPVLGLIASIAVRSERAGTAWASAGLIAALLTWFTGLILARL